MIDLTDYNAQEATLIQWIKALSGITRVFWTGRRFDRKKDDQEILIPYATIRENDEDIDPRSFKTRELTFNAFEEVEQVDEIHQQLSQRSYDLVFYAPAVIKEEDGKEINNKQTGYRFARTFIKNIQSQQSRTILRTAKMSYMSHGRIFGTDTAKPDKLIKNAAVEVFINVLNTMKEENVDFFKTIELPEITLEGDNV